MKWDKNPLTPFFFGEYELTIDEKNRLLVPAEVRRQLDPQRDGEAFFLVYGTNGVPWLYPERYYQQLVAEVPARITPDENTIAFEELKYGLAVRLEWDKQGRVLIPDKTLKRMKLGRDVTLVGARDKLQLWQRDIWEARREELLRRSGEIEARQAAINADVRLSGG